MNFSYLMIPPTLEVYWLLGWLSVGHGAGLLSAYLSGFFGAMLKDILKRKGTRCKSTT